VGVTTSVLAEDQADDNRLDEAWTDAVGDDENILTEKQFAMLNNLAFQAAVTKVCEGFDLDQSKFAKAIKMPRHRCRIRYVGGGHQGLGTAVIMRLSATMACCWPKATPGRSNFVRAPTNLRPIQTCRMFGNNVVMWL
jgi:hypothetical protein